MFGAVKAVDSLNLEIAKGECFSMLGPSGCGKTTLLRLLSGQVKPQSGSVWVDGCEVNRLSDRDLLALRRRLGMLFQFGALFTDLNVFENVAFPSSGLVLYVVVSVVRYPSFLVETSGDFVLN